MREADVKLLYRSNTRTLQSGLLLVIGEGESMYIQVLPAVA